MLNHFNFKRFGNNALLLTNDFGNYAFLTPKEFIAFLTGRINDDSPLYDELRKRRFYVEQGDTLAADVIQEMRIFRHYLSVPTSLHIFVLTNACNMACVYCQAQASQEIERSMSIETAIKATEVALQSPAMNLTFEFQGGEPLLNFSALKAVVEYAEAAKGKKNVRFTLVSNLSVLTEEKLDFLLQHNVMISTSLDGPSWLHDKNRPRVSAGGSHEALLRSLAFIRKRGCGVGALQTTTKASLPYAKEIVREYIDLGFNSIFLRPLSPLGFAQAKWNAIGYRPEEFLLFYREAMDAVLRANWEGKPIREQTAAIFLQKILHGTGMNYMDLRSPCGAGFGQLAYFYDGNVYTCDEARMLAEGGDKVFLLGSVFSSKYRELVSCSTCQATSSASITESIPDCCDCVYQPYCGVCPVVSYATGGDVIPRSPRSYRCMIYQGILDYLFELIKSDDSATMDVLESWTHN